MLKISHNINVLAASPSPGCTWYFCVSVSACKCKCLPLQCMCVWSHLNRVEGGERSNKGRMITRQASCSLQICRPSSILLLHSVKHIDQPLVIERGQSAKSMFNFSLPPSLSVFCSLFFSPFWLALKLIHISCCLFCHTYECYDCVIGIWMSSLFHCLTFLLQRLKNGKKNNLICICPLIMRNLHGNEVSV